MLHDCTFYDDDDDDDVIIISTNFQITTCSLALSKFAYYLQHIYWAWHGVWAHVHPSSTCINCHVLGCICMNLLIPRCPSKVMAASRNDVDGL